MTSAAKIAANRRNARKSTGPRSQAGKMRSRRNAFRHGLATPIASDIALAGQIESLTNELAATATQPAQYAAARIAALSQIELARAQSVKVQLIDRAAQNTQEKIGYDPNKLAILGYAEQLQTLVRLDRYERRALSRRNRALRAFDSSQVHQSKTTAVRWCKLFVQPVWAFNVHALIKTMRESMSHGGDWTCPQIEGLRVSLQFRDDQSGSIWFAFSQDPSQEFAIAKVLRRRGGRQWGAVCSKTGKTIEDLLLRDSERHIGSRYALGLSYRSKYRKSPPAHPLSDVVAASATNELDTKLSRPQPSEPKDEQ